MLRWKNVDIAETPAELLDAHTTALLMWDYASGLVERAFNRDEFVESSERLLSAARRAGIPIFFSQQGNIGWEDVGPGLIRMRMKQMNMLNLAGFSSINAKGTAGGEFWTSLQPRADDVVFEKFLPNAFSGTNLSWRLRARGIKTLVIAGISVETGVDGTAREAVNNGYYAVIAREAVSSTRKSRFELSMPLIEELHDVMGCAEIEAAWTVTASRKDVAND